MIPFVLVLFVLTGMQVDLAILADPRAGTIALGVTVATVVGKQLGVMDEAMLSVIVIMVILTTLITPPVLTWLLRRN